LARRRQVVESRPARIHHHARKPILSLEMAMKFGAPDESDEHPLCESLHLGFIDVTPDLRFDSGIPKDAKPSVTVRGLPITR
jgi:hypothetical protein